MKKHASYLTQFIAAVMITAGGITVVCFMVRGQHCVYGWLIIILGMVCLIIGSRSGSQDKDS